jgi:L-aspartate oxidase
MKIKDTKLRRYLVPVDTGQVQQIFTDCLVIGAGIAGLRSAIGAAESVNVTIVCKGDFTQSNTWQAQGGIASVLGAEDSFESHIADTVSTGHGLCDEDIVRSVVSQGPELVRQLLDWGTEFDTIDGQVDITLEGGHSHARVIHAHGDSTGRAISEALMKKIRSTAGINVMEKFYTIDLITEDNRCLGAIGARPDGQLQIIWSNSTILATGGAGRLYRETTNPDIATADGIAMAYRAGAKLRDMEFMQFHPTTLYIAGASRALVTETLRGEGAKLLDIDKEPFMSEYDQKAELAPRDVVSRAILDRMLKKNSTHVYLDVRHFDKEHFQKRFPYISELCESFDIDISGDLIPVRPSAHYMIGGVRTDARARTSIENLYAAGEAASTALHGANRLGSNSLLEGLVFGKIAAARAAQSSAGKPPTHKNIKYDIPAPGFTRLDASDVVNSLRALMWRNVGITRTATALKEAQEIIGFWQRYVMDKVFDAPFDWQCQNMLTVAMLMAKAAQQRTESRGTHYRRDCPETDEKNFTRHIEIQKQNL